MNEYNKEYFYLIVKRIGNEHEFKKVGSTYKTIEDAAEYIMKQREEKNSDKIQKFYNGEKLFDYWDYYAVEIVDDEVVEMYQIDENGRAF